MNRKNDVMHQKILIVEDEFIVANRLKKTLEKAGYTVCGIALSVKEALDILNAQRPGLVLLDIYLQGELTGIALAATLHEQHIPFVYLSANSNQSILEEAKQTRPSGFLVKPFREKDLLLTLDIAFYRYQSGIESQQHAAQTLKQALDSIAGSHLPTVQKLLEAAKALQLHIPFDYLSISIQGHQQDSTMGYGFLRINLHEYQTIGVPELANITRVPLAELRHMVLNSQPLHRPAVYNGADFEGLANTHPALQLLANTFPIQSALCCPLLLANGSIVTLFFYSFSINTLTDSHLDFLLRVRNLLEMQFQHIFTDTEKPGTVVAAPAAIPAFEGIIGQSPGILTVLDTVKRVAATDTSVLVLGENGTGKEKIAASIHALSRRRNKPLVIVNCAALPPTLIESELFGHEKGSFTGAHETRIGKFEQASSGTIFFDEIGELPLALQSKLLRVLQEREVERIGGKAPKKIDVRIIAATNRNLEKEVAEGRFRMDLYYRLHVIPVVLPPLRERKEDIPLLARYFLEQQARKLGKGPYHFTEKALLQFMNYDWPGNIRELENLVERSVVMARGAALDLDFFAHGKNAAHPIQQASSIKTIQETERDHIIEILKKSNGKIYGPGGAAEMLNIPGTTLSTKIKKLGIIKKLFS